MKKKFPALLLAVLLLPGLFACGGKKTPADTDGTAESVSAPEATSAETQTEETQPEETQPEETQPEETQSTETTSAEEETTLSAAPVAAELSPGCFFGDYTGTDRTLTGLEPLPENGFPDAAFPSPETFSTGLREHSYGVAKNGRANEISVENQRFFDEGGYDALCLDTKTEGKTLYLTFDCGYENGYTAKILDTLRDKKVPAAFFCTLPQMKENGKLIARMINEGHIVGNHSVTHPNFANLSRKKMFEEVKGFDDYLRENFGYSALYFRYPQGKYSEASLDLLNSMGYRCVFWSLAYADWDLNDQKGASYARETVVSRLHPGAVILLHAVSPDNANALASIIDAAREEGYTFRALSEFNAKR